MNIVAVQFKSRKDPDEFDGREYSYFSKVALNVGDVIVVPTKKGQGLARVARTDMADSEIDEDVRPYMRTIEELIKPEDVEV